MATIKFILSIIAIVILSTGFVESVQVEATGNRNFADVSVNNPYFNIVHEMRDLNIIGGYEDGSFKPSEVISRKHAAALVSRTKDLVAVKPFVKFNDVSEKNAYFNDIKELQQAGIFTSDSNGNFNPNQAITRAEMAKVLALAFKLETKSTYDFPDVPSTHSANKYVRAIYSNGITTGDNGMFLPNESLTRVHYAVFMHRALNISGATPTTPPTAPIVDVVKQLEQSSKDNAVAYEAFKPFDKASFVKNPISAKMHLEGVNAVKANNMKFFTGYLSEYTSNIRLSSDGYKNPIERFVDVEFLFLG